MSMRKSLWIVLVVGLCVLSSAWMGIVAKETTTQNPDDQIVIEENIRLLKKDCRTYGNFGYCPRNPKCFQHGNGMWDLTRRPTLTCDPRNSTHYGCHCRWSAFVDKTCTEVPCFHILRRYFQNIAIEENQAQD